MDFKVGDRIKYVKPEYWESEWNPLWGGIFGNVAGTITGIGYASVAVLWDNKKKNSYNPRTLELISRRNLVIINLIKIL